MKVEAALFGKDEVKKLLRKYDEKLNHRLGTALSRVGLYVKREAQLRVPVDTGALKNSARTKLTRRKNLKSEVNISFNTNYAVFVHDRHKEKSKYLERAYRENIFELQRILREAMS